MKSVRNLLLAITLGTAALSSGCGSFIATEIQPKPYLGTKCEAALLCEPTVLWPAIAIDFVPTVLLDTLLLPYTLLKSK